jgi:hypothetical protein
VTRRLAFEILPLAMGLVGCKAAASTGAPSPSASASGAAAPARIAVDHGELDTKAPDKAPRIAATVIAATVYKLPDTNSRKLGYIRLGGSVPRDEAPVPGKGCKGDFYHV